MNNSFASLLRQSRLASFDANIKQVYSTPKKHKAIGDWGLKRNLPTVIRTPHITIGDLDSSEHQTPWQSGTSQVAFVQRWKENFPNSKRPSPRTTHVEHNIAAMSPVEFKRFIKQASKQAPAFQEELKRKTVVPEQVFEYLGATFQPVSSTNGVVGPTYSDYQGLDKYYPVNGRILNADQRGYAVGVAGVVASLPKTHAVNLKRKSDRRVRRFYVESAEIDAQGTPHVVLRMQPPLASSTSSSAQLSVSNAMSDDKMSHMFTSMRAEDMFLTQKRTQRTPTHHHLHDESHTKEDPKHQQLMDMFASLMNSSKPDDKA